MATGRPNGRPPKPVEVKEANGNPGGRKLPETRLGLETRDDIPEPPASLTAEGKRVWNDLWQSTSHAKTPDYFVMLLFVQTWMEYVWLTSEIKKGDAAAKKDPFASKRIAQNPNGTVQTHPFWTQQKETKVQLNTYMSSLGITPADRARLLLAADADAEKAELKKFTGRNAREVS